ncbi:MAG: TRAP-type mannitol/chloroaromatic compound transport system substrate-binding protein [bacterium]|jgi:TRAP-type mannitol/chloroaromatic compound transport system substrate-binding protein
MRWKLIFLPIILLSACQQQDKNTENEVVKWDLQSQANLNSIDFIELEKLAENIKIMSKGRFIITVHSAGKIISGSDVIASVAKGHIQMGNGWPNWWAGQDPSWAVMNGGPFDFMNIDSSIMFFFEGGGTEMANELSNPKGVLCRPAWWTGMEFGLLSKTPIRGLDDLKNKKIRVSPGLASEVFAEASGAYVIPLVQNEIYPSLKEGAIDAAEWTTSNGVLNLGIHDLAPYAIVPAVWQPSILSDFLINQEAYNKLDEDLKVMFETSLKAYTLTTTIKGKVKDIEAMETLLKEGLNVDKWSPKDIKTWKTAHETVILKYEKNPYTKKVLDEKKKFKEAYRNYYKYFQKYD